MIMWLTCDVNYNIIIKYSVVKKLNYFPNNAIIERAKYVCKLLNMSRKSRKGEKFLCELV